MRHLSESGEEKNLELSPILPISEVWLIHGKGGSPEGTVRKLETVLARHWPGLAFRRPSMPHRDPMSLAESSVDYLLGTQIPQNALLVGISLGGVVAAKTQELGRADLQVISISAPTWADGVALRNPPGIRLAFYSSKDPVIGERTENWSEVTTFQRNFSWLTHDTDQHLRYIARLFDWYLEGMLVEWIHRVRSRSLTKQERDDIVWRNMAKPRDFKGRWEEAGATGARPRDFTEIGEAIRAGRSWQSAWGDWQHEFIYRKDSRCLASEPPIWFERGRRALMAGAAEFFARLYGLARPIWVDNAEYFLSEFEMGSPFTLEPDDDGSSAWLPDSPEEIWRMKARTPQEMLRRNVIFEARSLTIL